jgi:hypothetical protein
VKNFIQRREYGKKNHIACCDDWNLLGAFGLGYLCGSVSWQRAHAQDLGAEADFRAVFHAREQD